MTLPYSTLQKMWLPPYYLLFSVAINGEKYLGRVNMLRYEQNFNKPSIGVFTVYKSTEDFKGNIIDQEIETSSDKVVILEIIDTHSDQHPSPINRLITLCTTLNNISNEIDIGTIRRKIPDILEQIVNSINDFTTIHPIVKKSNAPIYIEELMEETKKISDDWEVDKRRTFIIDLKERILYWVDDLIRFSESNT